MKELPKLPHKPGCPHLNLMILEKTFVQDYPKPGTRIRRFRAMCTEEDCMATGPETAGEGSDAPASCIREFSQIWKTGVISVVYGVATPSIKQYQNDPPYPNNISSPPLGTFNRDPQYPQNNPIQNDIEGKNLVLNPSHNFTHLQNGNPHPQVDDTWKIATLDHLVGDSDISTPRIPRKQSIDSDGKPIEQTSRFVRSSGTPECTHPHVRAAKHANGKYFITCTECGAQSRPWTRQENAMKDFREYYPESSPVLITT